MSGNIADRRVVILSACSVPAGLARLLRPDDFVIACDAGYRNAEALGVTPDLILGDFDSAPQPEAEDLVVLPHVKDDTDTHYAAVWAAEHGAKEVLMLGALGGKRLEHTLANLSTGLFLSQKGIDVTIADEYSHIRYLLPEKPVTALRENWEYFSVIPLGDRLEGVSISGAFYPLQDAVITADYVSLAVSNEFVEESVTIRCKKGAGAVILTKES